MLFVVYIAFYPHLIMKNALMKVFNTQDRHEKVSCIQDYQESLRTLQHIALSWNLTEKDIDHAMEKSIQSFLGQSQASARKFNQSKLKLSALCCLNMCLKLSLFVVAVFVIAYILLQHKPTQYFIQSRLQDYIYPGMKILRKLSLPIISTFPSLTDFYDENCLVSNPFFRLSDLPCPCENVRAILNLTGEDTTKEQYHSGIPYVVKTNGEEVTWEKLRALYHHHNIIFDHNANHVTLSSLNSRCDWVSPASLFASDWSSNDSHEAFTHVIWRSNRMEPTRLLRSVFGLPFGEPSYAAGITIEKLVVIDGPKALPHPMPTTDGTTVFIQQSSGSRLIVLTPANECSHRCSPVSVLLPPSHILWYSWWYWRASSLPSPASSSLSIEYVGSHR